MITPNFLKPGDTVAIVSTARKVSKEELEPGLQLLEEWGLQPLLGKTIGAEHNQFAGNDILRTADFQAMLDSPTVKAIWCARGGYGTVRMVDGLNFSEFKKHPKWIIGYSDITVLHSHIHNLGVETMHADMPADIGKRTVEAATSIKNILFGEEYKISFPSEEKKVNRTGKAVGQLVGGNLSVLYSILGSAFSANTDGKILFIEDLDEYLYHIDRMMQNLKRSGFLKNLAGLVVGGMNDMNDNTIPFGKTAAAIIAEAVSEYEYPVCFNAPAGHIKDNRALIMGRKIRLEVNEVDAKLTF
ncbi:MAG: LD-carboxypeptidase [Flavobacteriaceae bacterium]|jgi:muramoyltetrapeptide carboxypeptidase|nr:LD-carboxypeptidase [Flavobacteriaceae bacterium]HBY66616.1 LD-carboxypeptidase [Flavobacteriaceae bacterium]|tara:strand:+ start:65383 stop:66282 length:900 start_codon:yes stop_codon:yes gene_type:complete